MEKTHNVNQVKCANCEYYSDVCKIISKSETKHNVKTPHAKKDSLCWCCKHSVPNRDGSRGCDWSLHNRPIIHWVAQKRIVDGHASYNVERCPMFERWSEYHTMEGKT